MNRLLCIVFIQFMILSHSFCDSVLIVPFTVYDHNNMTVKLTEKPEEVIFKTLKFFDFGGIINFRDGGKRYPSVYTAIDANKVCSVSNCDYVLYGYIQKNENSWYGNLKLYDSSKKKIIKEFFASDDVESYERFLSVLGDNVIFGLEEISGYFHGDKKEIDYRHLELSAGFGLDYWTPLTEGWIETVTGLGGLHSNIQMYIPHKRTFLWDYEMDYSMDFRISYSYGMGKQNMYPLNYHVLKTSLPFLLHSKIDKRNGIYIGTGLFCEFDFLDIVERYSKRKLHYQNIFGLEGIIGYEFAINSDSKLFFETSADFHFSRDSYISLRPSVGAMFRLYEGGK